MKKVFFHSHLKKHKLKKHRRCKNDSEGSTYDFKYLVWFFVFFHKNKMASKKLFYYFRSGLGHVLFGGNEARAVLVQKFGWLLPGQGFFLQTK